ncbi:MAG: hypothetical protein CM15mV6_0330 [uncultured marine virus]|nr:MAG: hypothetical protein CM15mV6_0330 [uncultured marine virus]
MDYLKTKSFIENTKLNDRIQDHKKINSLNENLKRFINGSNNLNSGTTEEIQLNELAGVSPEERQGIYCDEDGNPIKLTYDQLVQDFVTNIKIH